MGQPESRTTTTQPATARPPLCQYGGTHCPPAAIVDGDGAWCSHECRDYDRQAEVTTPIRDEWLRVSA